jgi:LmbE family N-acetylglucosaminyl deacetylase
MRTVSQILAGFMALPQTNVETVLGGQRALILSPHADDESLGCGGLIAAASAVGIAPIVVILTDGTASHPASLAFPPERLRTIREAEAVKATGLLGLPSTNLHFMRHRDTQLSASGPEFVAITATLLEIARTQYCGLVIAPWAGDPHCDHEAAACIAEAVAGRAHLRLLSYPVWGWLRDHSDILDEPRHNGSRLNISAQREVKKQAIAAYESQFGDLIADSTNGFRLPDNLLAIFDRPFEVFIA